METQSPSLEAFRKVIEAADSSRVTKDDFTALAKQIIELVKADKTVNGEKRAEMAQMMSQAMSAMQSRMDSDMSDLRSSIESAMSAEMSRMMSAHEEKMKMVDEKMDSVRDGVDADEESMMAKMKEEMMAPMMMECVDKIEKDLPQLGASIRDGLELLQGDERLDAKFIKGLEERLAKIEQKGNYVGGGASVIHKFIDDETPSGTINSSNTTFTLAKAPIAGSLKLYLGGARQRVTEDFTLSNKTITFTIAPDTGSILLADYRHF